MAEEAQLPPRSGATSCTDADGAGDDDVPLAQEPARRCRRDPKAVETARAGRSASCTRPSCVGTTRRTGLCRARPWCAMGAGGFDLVTGWNASCPARHGSWLRRRPGSGCPGRWCSSRGAMVKWRRPRSRGTGKPEVRRPNPPSVQPDANAPEAQGPRQRRGLEAVATAGLGAVHRLVCAPQQVLGAQLAAVKRAMPMLGAVVADSPST